MTNNFQARVDEWMDACFGQEIKNDLVERADRFVEESLELTQTVDGFTKERAHALVEYVFGRPVGERPQEVGGVKVTLAALCNAGDVDIEDAAETELSRISQPEMIEKIRAKQAAKPTGSALPIAHPYSPILNLLDILQNEKILKVILDELENKNGTSILTQPALAPDIALGISAAIVGHLERHGNTFKVSEEEWHPISEAPIHGWQTDEGEEILGIEDSTGRVQVTRAIDTGVAVFFQGWFDPLDIGWVPTHYQPLPKKGP